MKLQIETVTYMQTLSVEDRRKFIAYLKDADANIASEVNHLDNEMLFEPPDEPKQ